MPKPTAKPANQSGKGKGGPRPGSGRKPNAVTTLKRSILDAMKPVDVASKNDAAVYAFNLFIDTMRDDLLPLNVRLECAHEVLNRVWGKPIAALPQAEGKTLADLVGEARDRARSYKPDRRPGGKPA